MKTELLTSKNLSDMTNAELQELRESINKIELQRMKINAVKLRELSQELNIEG